MKVVERSLIDSLNQPLESLEASRETLHLTYSRLSSFLQLLQAYVNFESLPKDLIESIGALGVCHSPGFLQKALTPKKTVPRQMIDAWIRDTEHGLLHGLSAAFFAVLFAGRGRIDLNIDNEEIIASCLLHDFLRCSDIHEDHDTLLREWYPNLLPITYVHSNPGSDQIYQPLVIGDRIELLRFHDHAEWIDESVIELYLQDTEIRGIVSAYYRFVRPSLEKIFQNWGEQWLRHSVESEALISTANIPGEEITGYPEDGEEGMYPSRYWAPYPGFWSVEIGTAPFDYNIARKKDLYHPLFILSLSRYFELNGKPLRPVRDHLVASGSIPRSEWIVLLEDTDLDNRKNHELLMHSGGFIPLAIVNTMIPLAEYLQAFMKVVRVREKSIAELTVINW